jgi:hypothetical protein
MMTNKDIFSLLQTAALMASLASLIYFVLVIA